MADWRSYDGIAETYERLHAPRLAEPAGDLVAIAGIAADERVLDVGAGTGLAGEAALRAGARVVGVDASVGMLTVASHRRPDLPLVAAEAIDLPFRNGSFDVVVGGFVLSHFAKIETALFDVLRVVRPGGRVAFSAWADREPDAFERAWGELVTTVVPPRMLTSAMERALPGRELLAKRDALASTLADSGVRQIRTEHRRYRWIWPLDEYVEGLTVWAQGRFVRDMLGEAGWPSFLERVRREFRSRFPDPLQDFRDVVFAVGTKA